MREREREDFSPRGNFGKKNGRAIFREKDEMCRHRTRGKKRCLRHIVIHSLVIEGFADDLKIGSKEASDGQSRKW